MQKGVYDKGKRVKPDELRKLYKLYHALVLEALVDETPVRDIIKVYYPCSDVSAETAYNLFHKAVQELQVQLISDLAAFLTCFLGKQDIHATMVTTPRCLGSRSSSMRRW